MGTFFNGPRVKFQHMRGGNVLALCTKPDQKRSSLAMDALLEDSESYPEGHENQEKLLKGLYWFPSQYSGRPSLQRISFATE